MKGTYKSWADMKYRCDKPANKDYKNYGARGITYCEAWKVYTNFRRDMGRKPKGMSLGRKDNSKGYSPENCQWETSVQQNNNRRERTVITKRSDNTSGIVGVSFDAKRNRYVAHGKRNGVKASLYYGPDFFEACCARKSWEAAEKRRLQRE